MDTDFEREAAVGTEGPPEIGRATAAWVGTAGTPVATGFPPLATPGARTSDVNWDAGQ